MTKLNLLLLAIALAIFGGAVLVGHPPWGAVTGISILLTACALGAGAITTGPPSEAFAELKVAHQRVPSSLVALSATAIVAVYAAGYYRTRSAADQFETQAARRNAVPPAVTAAAIPKLALPPLEPPAPAKRSATSPRKNNTVRPAAPTSAAPPDAAVNSEPPAVPTATLPPVAPASEPSAEPSAPVVAKTQSPYKDGTFLGWGRCRHGSIQASVSLEGGQITATEITQCLTRYSCSWISALPGQVITRQSATVDYVSGATESTDAFYEAISSALAAARE